VKPAELLDPPRKPDILQSRDPLSIGRSVTSIRMTLDDYVEPFGAWVAMLAPIANDLLEPPGLDRVSVAQFRMCRENPVPARGAAKRSAIGPASSDPHRDSRCLSGGWSEDRLLHKVVTTLEGEWLPRPKSSDDLERLIELPRATSKVTVFSEGLELLVRLRSEARANPRRPPESKSSEAISRATFQGLRRGNALTSTPISLRSSCQLHEEPRIAILADVREPDGVVHPESLYDAAATSRCSRRRRLRERVDRRQSSERVMVELRRAHSGRASPERLQHDDWKDPVGSILVHGV
jgi:hypothetical protein